MQSDAKTKTALSQTKRQLVEAAVDLMRLKGYSATTVDDICQEAEVTKGAFFHYFKSKEDIAKAALTYFSDNRVADSNDAPYRALPDPLQRVYGRLDYIKESVGGAKRLTKGCLIGTFAQELSFTNPALREACQAMFLRMAADFEKDIAAAKALYAANADFDSKSLAQLYVSIFQGSSMMAKASESNAVLLANIEQFRRYLQTLFGQANRRSGPRSTNHAVNH